MDVELEEKRREIKRETHDDGQHRSQPEISS